MCIVGYRRIFIPKRDEVPRRYVIVRDEVHCLQGNSTSDQGNGMGVACSTHGRGNK